MSLISMLSNMFCPDFSARGDMIGCKTPIKRKHFLLYFILKTFLYYTHKSCRTNSYLPSDS